jgi:sugar phosphate isomerase/epimerase
MRSCGYDAVELQIADPAQFDEARVRTSLDAAGLPLCAFQTGSTYASRGNCLCSPDPVVRERTAALLRSFVELAGRWKCILIFGSLQGRLSDEPDYEAGRKRIVQSLGELCAFAAERGVVIAVEPVNHLEVGWHNTIADVARLVRSIARPSARLMIDTFHMNIEERDMVVPFMSIMDILVHVHLSETNRDVLGLGHGDLQALCDALGAIEFAGHCSIGVYNTIMPRGECISLCMHAVKEALG